MGLRGDTRLDRGTQESEDMMQCLNVLNFWEGMLSVSNNMVLHPCCPVLLRFVH